ncbi:L-serine ammonia-lyase [Aureimonas sp. ME7]|uniref:L-serine ammonia-lyase n=1 Tax=Aureimonas sp. ME7 TaxID=2744252 RepID=UPI0015F50374|nr:L-serine ammonia-lyase [Aureimonas sp. ME7]
MFLSVFDVFKIGIGPSSSHTMGPMTAAARFLERLRQFPDRDRAARIRTSLHGSLAFTGKGHATDRAVALGLLGWLPASLDIEAAERQLADLAHARTLRLPDLSPIDFDPAEDIVFDYGPPLPGHANGLVFSAFDAGGELLLTETFYSIGGGFVVTAAERERPAGASVAAGPEQPWPFPFRNAADMLRMAGVSGLSIADMKRENETRLRSRDEVAAEVDHIWAVMDACIERGLAMEGELPGGLKVRRRARRIHQQLLAERQSNIAQPHATSDWLGVYAMAVNEENAAGGRVVTSPTNGAAGVVPAVLRYYLDHCHGADRAKVSDFLLTAAAIGGLIKHNASISGAEAGCQGEVGSAAAMAAAGLCAVLGGTPEQVENAAEIALEHHLGMTCDPVAGLVQVPCIERNGIGAIKAVAAASLALRGDGSHFMPLDNCIEAMRQTGEDMNTKFKETSLGGLAVNLPEC